jgi:predicted ribonuclease YlaK
VLHRNPDVREKAVKVIARIKGWRRQGSLLEGVTVDGTITVIAVAEEPNMRQTLSWLDSENADDRVIAGILELHARHPAERVILVSGDINLQNKADAASIEVVDPPTV